MSRTTRLRRSVVLAATATLVLGACGGGGGGGGDAGSGASVSGGSGTGEIKVWGHQGEAGEVSALQKTVADFNSSQTEVKATLQLIPSADYTKTVTASNEDQLPDVLEYDGPLMSSFVYDKKLSPIEGLVAASTVDNQTDSAKAQNTYAADSKLYGVSQYDAGLGIYANKKLLDAAGVKYPTGLGDAWTAADFESALQKLSAQDKDKKVLDIKENYGGEWPTYGYLPVINSAGSVVVKDGKAEGNLNSPAAVQAVKQFATWRQYVDPNSDDKAFTDKRVALSWTGHWVYNGYAKALGKDLIVLPLPDFGAGTKSGQGSWAWGVGSSSTNGKAAGKFLDYLTSDANVTAITDANAAPPGTKTVIDTDPLYKTGGPLELFAAGLAKTCGSNPPTPACVATPRPVTAAYPVISQQFSQAFFNAYKGGDAQSELDKAAKAIDQDYEDNNNYR